jgi:hypothetical protein
MISHTSSDTNRPRSVWRTSWSTPFPAQWRWGVMGRGFPKHLLHVSSIFPSISSFSQVFPRFSPVFHIFFTGFHRFLSGFRTCSQVFVFRSTLPCFTPGPPRPSRSLMLTPASQTSASPTKTSTSTKLEAGGCASWIQGLDPNRGLHHWFSFLAKKCTRQNQKTWNFTRQNTEISAAKMKI